jgi:hypothetical protein
VLKAIAFQKWSLFPSSDEQHLKDNLVCWAPSYDYFETMEKGKRVLSNFSCHHQQNVILALLFTVTILFKYCDTEQDKLF